MTSALAAAVAAYGLSTGRRLPDEPLSNNGFHALLQECEHHRIIGFLGTAVRDGAFPVRDAQRVKLEAAWQSWLAHSLRIEQLVLDANEVLREAGIPSLVLKGVALAHTAYPEPSMRVFGDADLLVEPHHFTRAANRLISELGGERRLPELRRGFDDRFGKEILLEVSGFEVDLHRMFVEGPYGLTMHLDDLWIAPEEFELRGGSICTLGAPLRTLHAAYAAVLGDWPARLAPARDFLQSAPGHDWQLDAVIDVATRWRAEAVLALAATTTASALESPLPPALDDWAKRFAPPWRDRIYLDSYRRSGRGYARGLVAPYAVTGVRNKTRFVMGIAFPQRSYRDARGLTPWEFPRRAYRSVTKPRTEAPGTVIGRRGHKESR